MWWGRVGRESLSAHGLVMANNADEGGGMGSNIVIVRIAAVRGK